LSSDPFKDLHEFMAMTRSRSPNVKFIAVATKMDLWMDLPIADKITDKVRRELGIESDNIFGTSSVTGLGVNDVFSRAGYLASLQKFEHVSNSKLPLEERKEKGCC
jgi:ethanolamine utilization protein EutP (predicted NTPase)